MGWLSKAWGGVKKTFKKIGKGIKKAVTSIGKFMNKIGIVGQIAMAFILPGIGNMLMNGLGGIASSMVTNTLGGLGGAIVKGAGHVVSAAHKFVTVGKNAFNTVTEGVTKFVGEFGKTALNKIPGVNIQSASKNFFGKGGAWETVQNDIVKNAGNILNPYKSSVNIREGMDIKDVMNSTGVSKQRIQEMNIGVDLDNLKIGESLNFDAGSIGRPMTGDQIKELTGVDFGGTTKDFSDFSDQQLIDFANSPIGQEVAKSSGVPMPTPEPIMGPRPRGAPPAKYTGADLPALRDISKGFIPQSEMESMNLGFDTAPYRQQSSIMAPPKVVTDPSLKDPMDRLWAGAQEEIGGLTESGGRYDLDKPFSSATQAVQDIGTVQQIIEPEVEQDAWGSYTPSQYVATGVYDAEVMAPQYTPRNFNTFANMGQFGSPARYYDINAMTPVSSYSRNINTIYGYGGLT